MNKTKTVSYRDVRDNLKHNMHLLLSPLMCDYVSARYLIISDNLNGSALSLISQFLEKSLKQIIILENKEEVLEHFQETNADIFSFLDKKKLKHHNLVKILNDFNQIEIFKEILENEKYLEFFDKFSEHRDRKYFSGLRYGQYFVSIAYPNMLDILDELAYRFINVEITRLSNHPIKVRVPENMIKLFLLKNKIFSIDTVEEPIPLFPGERLI